MSRRDLALGLMWGWAAGMATNLALDWLEHLSGYEKPTRRSITMRMPHALGRVKQHDPRSR